MFKLIGWIRTVSKVNGTRVVDPWILGRVVTLVVLIKGK